MAIMIFLVLALAVGGTGAGELDDFTNNLATDLGPLLALFGDDLTKQYLSESTKFVDYIIFAMAPVGILTALVSVIRVCGDTSLRAFIGKAQEADGAIEAELCTSTSRDVCELFNQAGITRVLGRPRLLELVYYPDEAKNKKPHMGIHIFRDHLTKDGGDWYEKLRPALYLDTAWRRAKSVLQCPGAARSTTDIEAPKVIENDKKSPMATVRSITTQDTDPTGQLESSTAKNASPTSSQKSRAGKVAKNPSLSLNVGIRKLPPWVFYIGAAIGVTLQFGVIAMAGLVSWKAGWTETGISNTTVSASAALAQNKSPLIFIVGTSAMCSGVFLCAVLIGESTWETTYRRETIYRRETESPASTRDSAIAEPQTKSPASTGDSVTAEPQTVRSRLLWLQPGDQVIGDQSFDAYAYFEDPHKPLSEYITSHKDMSVSTRFHLYTWFAVVLAMGGYLAQFIGVRGMSVYVSIAQFGSTVIMTFLRGLLRARRIDKTNNKLADMQELVVGHELDWLAFKIWNGSPKDGPHVDGTAGDRSLKDGSLKDGSLKNGSPKNGSPKDGSPNGGMDEDYCPLIHVMSDKAPDRFDSEIMKHTGSISGTLEHDKGSQLFLNDLTLIRTRLAHLTGHFLPGTPDLDTFQEWQDNQVKVRTKARQIADAICDAAEVFISPRIVTKSFVLRLRIGKSAADGMPIDTEVVNIALTRAESPGARIWSIDSSKLEAILGLWIWSIKAQAIVKENGITNAERFPNARFVFVNGSKFASLHRDNAKTWMDAKARALLVPGTIRLQNSNVLHLSRVWHPHALTGEIAADDPKSRTEHPNIRRFFGGNFHLNGAESSSFESVESPSFEIAFAETTNDLMTQCAHDIYSILLESLVGHTGINIGELIMTQEMDGIGWMLPAIVDTTKCFVATGLGSSLDASLCISSALSPFLCEDETMAYAILKRFTEYKKLGSLYVPDDGTEYWDLDSMTRAAIDQMFADWEARYKNYPESSPHEEYIYICLLETHRNTKLLAAMREWTRGRWFARRKHCREIREITEMYLLHPIGTQESGRLYKGVSEWRLVCLIGISDPLQNR
jgi:hypothetical protein